MTKEQLLQPLKLRASEDFVNAKEGIYVLWDSHQNVYYPCYVAASFVGNSVVPLQGRILPGQFRNKTTRDVPRNFKWYGKFNSPEDADLFAKEFPTSA